MTRLSDVAARARVSVSAASRVLSNASDTRVSDETRTRILKAARDLAYRPNSAGRALRSARTQVVALIVPDLMNAIFLELVRGAEDAAIREGYLVLMGRIEDVGPGNERLHKLLGEGRVDAVLLQPPDEPVVGTTLDGFEEKMPVIEMNSTSAATPGSVTLPDEAAARLAARHLIELGHTRLGYVGGLPQSHTNVRRRRGFVDELSQSGLALNPAWESNHGYTAEDGKRAAAGLLTLHDRPTGLVVANVNAAIGLLAEARRLGVSIPDDLSVVTIHDSWTAENSWPPLTAVKMPWYDLGRRAFEEAFRRLDGQEPRSIVVTDPPPDLIVRESTGPVPR